MTAEHYRRALEAAVKEYESLGEERQRIDKRLAELAQTISTLSRLCGITPTVSMGLSDACRMVLRNAGLPMTPAELRDRLLAIGIDLSGYANALATIHTTLKRLNDAGELRSVNTPGPRSAGEVSVKTAYIWDRPPKAAMLGPDAAQVMREIAEQEKKPARKRGAH